MRKITYFKKRLFFVYILATLFSVNLIAQSWVEDVYIYDDFGTTGGTTSGNWVDGTLTYGGATGATGTATGSSNTFGSAINATNKNAVITSKSYNYTFVSNVKTFSTAYSSPSNKMTIQFICKIGAAQTYSGSYFYFRDNTNKPIFGLGFARINSGGNKWLAVGPIAYTLWANGSATYPNITTPALLPTAADAPALKVTAVLDFATHTYSLTATQGTYTANGSPEWTAGTNQYSATGISFLDNTASNVANLVFQANGYGNTSVTTATNFTFDNFKIAGEKLATTDKVTVNYKDALGNTLKTSREQLDIEVGTTYTATAADKTTFSDATNYYTYDATSTDNVVVVSGGTSFIDLKFKIVPITAATYTWTGITNSLWNDVNENFTTDGTNSIIYQTTNSVIFPATATNKTVTVSDPVNLGAGNVTVEASGYSFNGSSSLNGTGSLLVNLTGADALSLGVTNNLTGVTQVAGGNVTVTKSGVLGSGVNVTGASTLTYGATAVTIPATTFGVSSSIVAGTTASSLINGMSAGNGVKISVSAATNHASNDNTRAFDFAASGTLDAGSELELNGIGTDNRIGMTSASATYLANTKVTLKGAAMLYVNNAQSAASTINVGTLAGESGTKIGWGRSTALDRTITWSVGALNESSEFAGQITNIGGYSASGSSYLGNATNLEKVGTGTLTLSGTSTHNGTVTVNGGALNITGSLGAGAPVTVAAGAKLKGTGTILGTLTNHGTLEGSLNFNALTLSDTTSLNVTGFNPGEFDHITVVGTIVNGGILRINVASDPTGSGTIQLISAGTIDNTAGFTSVKVISPSNPAGAPRRAPNAGTTYTYDSATGVLSYAPKVITGIDTPHADLQVYPTLSRGNVFVNAENVTSISVVALNGQMMKQVNPSGNLTTVNLNGLANGSYILNVKFNDGLNKSQQILLQK